MNDRVLFISGRCEHSTQILKGIQQHPFLKTIFQIINIDARPYPNYIKSVPSMLVKNRVLTGKQVFEYLGKIVESKMEQEKRETQGSLETKDQGVCRINEDGELEGYCGDSGGIDFSMITEENDNNKDSRFIMHSNYDTIEGNSLSNAVYQGQNIAMETGDQMLGEKRQAFDSDFERLQAERAEMMGGQGPQGRR